MKTICNYCYSNMECEECEDCGQFICEDCRLIENGEICCFNCLDYYVQNTEI